MIHFATRHFLHAPPVLCDAILHVQHIRTVAATRQFLHCAVTTTLPVLHRLLNTPRIATWPLIGAQPVPVIAPAPLVSIAEHLRPATAPYPHPTSFGLPHFHRASFTFRYKHHVDKTPSPHSRRLASPACQVIGDGSRRSAPNSFR